MKTSSTAGGPEGVGARIKALREQAGMTQGDLAAAMRARGHHWNQPRVSQIEAGRRLFPITTVRSLAAVLGAPADDFIPYHTVTMEDENHE